MPSHRRKLAARRKLSVEPRPTNTQFTLYVAFSTEDRRRVDQHFGTATSVLIYGVDKYSWSLVEAIEYQDADEDRHAKLPTRIQDLAALNCVAIYCYACGVSAIKQLLQSGINPVKVPLGSDIHTLINGLQKELNGTATGWVKRALRSRDDLDKTAPNSQQRLADLMDEAWS
jgi:nitrogen fixation protein NifX